MSCCTECDRPRVLVRFPGLLSDAIVETDAERDARVRSLEDSPEYRAIIDKGNAAGLPYASGRGVMIPSPQQRADGLKWKRDVDAGRALLEKPLTFDETLDRGIDRVTRSGAGVGNAVGSMFGRTVGAAHETATGGKKLPGVGDLGAGLSDLLEKLARELGKPLLIGAGVLAGIYVLSK